MMETLKQVVLFYAAGAGVTAIFFSSFEMSGSWRDRPIKHPRLIGSIIIGIIWPAAIVMMIIGRPLKIQNNNGTK